MSSETGIVPNKRRRVDSVPKSFASTAWGAENKAVQGAEGKMVSVTVKTWPCRCGHLTADTDRSCRACGRRWFPETTWGCLACDYLNVVLGMPCRGCGRAWTVTDHAKYRMWRTLPHPRRSTVLCATCFSCAACDCNRLAFLQSVSDKDIAVFLGCA